MRFDSAAIVVSLFDRTGVMVAPWLEAGYECWIVDVKHPAGVHRDGLLVRVGADVRVWLPPRRFYVAAFAFPPLLFPSTSGDFRKRQERDEPLRGIGQRRCDRAPFRSAGADMKERPTPLGEMLMLYRAAHRLTLRELAPQIGIGHATLMRIETGQQCDVLTFLKLTNWLMRVQ